MRIMKWNKLYNNLNLNLSQLSKSFIKRYLILKEIVCYSTKIFLFYIILKLSILFYLFASSNPMETMIYTRVT